MRRALDSDVARDEPSDVERSEWRKISLTRVHERNTSHSGWIVVRERVYDITTFARHHPGFANAGSVSTALAIALALGSDATKAFEAIHSPRAWAQLAQFQIGVLARANEDVDDAWMATHVAPTPEFLSRDEGFKRRRAEGVSATTLAYLERISMRARGEGKGEREDGVEVERGEMDGKKARDGGGRRAARGMWTLSVIVVGAAAAKRVFVK